MLGMDGTAYASLDPAVEWTFSTWELFRCCLLRTLMSYDGTSGAAGTEPKPDLAIGPPVVSTDGLTWTFHLRPGLYYGPPLQDVAITAPDIARAILRSGDAAAANPYLGGTYLANIQGYGEYAAGKSGSISGLETPDPLTLRIHEIRPDSALPYDLTLPTTAPIPPSPSDPSARYGVATGHDSSTKPEITDGYGRYLVSSGPYMILGEDAVDFSKPAEEQVPARGFVPWTYDKYYSTKSYGSLTLVRNPSWSAATDPLRLALADRIEIKGGTSDALFREVSAGGLDMVFDDNPPPPTLDRYLNDPTLRPFVQTLDTGIVVVADFNLTQPPFDDVAVRTAVADALDRRAIVAHIPDAFPGVGGAIVANHYVSDSAEGSLASGWDPFPGQGGAPDLEAARAALSTSRYAKRGSCAGPDCRVTVIVREGLQPASGSIAHSLAALGIRADIHVTGDLGACHDLRVGLCVGFGWFPDYPSAGNLLIALFGGPSVGGSDSINISHIGSSAADLAHIGAVIMDVPTVDPQIQACNQEIGAAGLACWTRLDQYLVTQVMPAVPLAFGQVIRVTSPKMAAFSWDAAFQMPAIDRLSAAGA